MPTRNYDFNHAGFRDYCAKDLGLFLKKNHRKYSLRFELQDSSDEDWIETIRHHQAIMKRPNALREDRIILIDTPTDIITI